MDLIGELLKTELFEGFSHRDLYPLAPSLRRRTFPKGVFLWHAGDPVVAAYLVLSGLVRTRHLEADGSEITIQLCLPGETVGEYWFFEEHARRMYDVYAVEVSETIVIPRDPLLYVLRRDSALTMKLAASMIRRLARDHEYITAIQLVDLEGRLARRLLALASVRGEPVGDGTRIAVRLSQSLLASTVRASREHVNRALGRLAADGLIRVDDGFIVLRDRERLSERATPPG